MHSDGPCMEIEVKVAALPASSEAASIGRTECGEDNKERNDPRQRVKDSVSKSLRVDNTPQAAQMRRQGPTAPEYSRTALGEMKMPEPIMRTLALERLQLGDIRPVGGDSSSCLSPITSFPPPQMDQGL
ncbi:hypothetical protein INR49_031747 [Caranx melampygus]|nr:hypothetical protein INR49_031747 [Caranx melampygus]